MEVEAAEEEQGRWERLFPVFRPTTRPFLSFQAVIFVAVIFYLVVAYV